MQSFPVLLIVLGALEPLNEGRYTGLLEPSLTYGGVQPITLTADTDGAIARVPGIQPMGIQTFVGTMHRPLTNQAIELVLVEDEQTRLLYADVNGDGEFSLAERFVFSTSYDPLPSLVLKFPFPGRTQLGTPIHLRAVAPGPANVATRVLLRASEAFAIGTVDIGGRVTKVRVPFDLMVERIGLHLGQFGIDANGDGLIETDTLSPEYGWADEQPPVFRVGDHYVSVLSADLATSRLELRSHQASDYRRVELTPGSQLDFRFVDLDGKQRRLAEFKGRSVLIFVWTTSCPFVEEEIGSLNEAWDRFRTQGFEILGLNHGEGLEQVKDFVGRHRIHWPNAQPDSVMELLEERLRIVEFPTLLLLDREGRIVSRGRKGEGALRGRGLLQTIGVLTSPGH